MNIHLLMEGKFVDKFVEFINNFYPNDENYFYIYNNVDNCEQTSNALFSNVEYISDLFNGVDLSKIGKSGKIFFHGFFLNHFINYGLSIPKTIEKDRLILIIYGADLYNTRYILEENFFHPGLWIQEIKKKKMVRRFGTFMTFAAPDYTLIEKWYGGRGIQRDILYPSNANYELLSKIRKSHYAVGEEVRILLGNSATATNRHIEAIEVLSKYKDEKIQIVCPLSYGDMIYGEEIAKLGREIFGEKFIPVTEYMDIDSYTELLNSVDIAIYNNNRQQATGNIEILGYLGKKIFVRSDTTTWGHYVERDKCRFLDTINIKNLSFVEFCRFSEEDREFNKDYFLKIWDENYIKKIWDAVL